MLTLHQMLNATYREANVLLVRAILTSTPYFKICLTLQLCLGISAILSNSIVLGFYIKQKAGVVSTMYRLVQNKLSATLNRVGGNIKWLYLWLNVLPTPSLIHHLLSGSFQAVT